MVSRKEASAEEKRDDGLLKSPERISFLLSISRTCMKRVCAVEEGKIQRRQTEESRDMNERWLKYMEKQKQKQSNQNTHFGLIQYESFRILDESQIAELSC